MQKSLTGQFKFWSKTLNEETSKHKYLLWSYFVRKNTIKIKISASQCISNMNCMYYDQNKFLGVFKLSRAIENSI